MIVAGIYLTGRDARIIILKGTKKSHELLKTSVSKITTTESPTNDEIQDICRVYKSLCRDHNIDKVILNARNKSGNRQAGANTFLLEGMFRAISQIPVELVHHKTISVTNQSSKFLKTDKPNTKDLGWAFDLAFEGLE